MYFVSSTILQSVQKATWTAFMMGYLEPTRWCG